MTRCVRMGALRECARPFLVPFQLRRDDRPCLAIVSGFFAGRRLSGDNDEKKLACGFVVDVRTLEHLWQPHHLPSRRRQGEPAAGREDAIATPSAGTLSPTSDAPVRFSKPGPFNVYTWDRTLTV